MFELQQKVTDVVRKDPNVMNLISSMGGNPSFGGSLNQGRMFFRLKDKKDRVNHMSATEIIQKLRPKVAQVPGINVFLQIPPTIRIGGNLTKSQYQYALQTPDLPGLYSSAPKLEAALRNLAGSAHAMQRFRFAELGPIPSIERHETEAAHRHDEPAAHVVLVGDVAHQFGQDRATHNGHDNER